MSRVIIAMKMKNDTQSLKRFSDLRELKQQWQRLLNKAQDCCYLPNQPWL